MNDQMMVIITNLKKKIQSTKDRIWVAESILESDRTILADLLETYNVLKVHDEPSLCPECKQFFTPQDKAFNREAGTDHEEWICNDCDAQKQS